MKSEHEDGLTRRRALGAGALGAAILAAIPTLGRDAGRGEGGSAPQPDDRRVAPAGDRMPVVFAPHGGGPWPFVDLGLKKSDVDELAGYLRSIRPVPRAP